MKIIKDINKMQALVKAFKRQGKKIGFVPTMGYFHEGHLSLIRQAKSENDICLISIFVNPLQFGQKEDLKSYPRNFQRDCKLAKNSGVDLLFFPSANQMYSKGFLSEVYVNNLSQVLCGKSRPEHFKGVTTIVAKLFNITLPDIAYFGQKDFQQARIIERMSQDLNFPIEIRVMPIVRETDGLAMSSRNVYLSKQERRHALILYKSLCQAIRIIRQGCRSSAVVISSIKRLISTVKSAKIDYVGIVDTGELKPRTVLSGEIAILLAVKIGHTRLIDNIILRV